MLFNSLQILLLSTLCLAQQGQTSNTGSTSNTGTGSTNSQSGSSSNSDTSNGSANSGSSSSSSSSSTNEYSSEYGVIQFDNFGFEGYYLHVATLDSSDSCDCALASNSKRTIFSGSNAPLDEEVSVHFRGPLILKQFAYYVSESFQVGNDSSSDWERLSYYDASSSTSENVTFLTAAGDNSSCLGQALTYADSDGISEASASTILEESTLIHSDEEYIIFSNISCGDSGFSKDCGVYRSGIPAYHGFYGTTKLFLFEFEMPEETNADDNTDYYNLPAIWLLNAHIPRTSQYPTNGNCSCWNSGCGEFDIFEVMNSTEATHFYSTVHDFQGISDISTGIQAPGYLIRQYNSTMKGGVAFSSNGEATVFLSNSTSINSTISASDLNAWISSASEEDETVTDTLTSATNTGSGSVSAATGIFYNFDVRYVFIAFALVGSTVLF